MVFGSRLRNEYDWMSVSAPPIELPQSPPAREIALALLWDYAKTDMAGDWTDRGEVYREHPSIDPGDWEAAEEWLEEEDLVEILDRDEGHARGRPTPMGWRILRWWGWEDVARVSNRSETHAGDFLVVREPATRRYHVLRCGQKDCVTLVGPEGGAVSPSMAAMWARKIGGANARVWLFEREHLHLPISRKANALVAKDRLRAVS